MEYLVKSGSPEKQRVGCVIVGIFDRRKPSTQAEALDEASGGLIASVMRRGDMDGKLGQTTVLHGLGDLFCDRILLVGCGKERDFNTRAYQKACAAAAAELDTMGGVDAAFYLTELNVRGRDDFGWSVKQALLTIEDTFYRFEACKGPNYEKHTRKLSRLVFQVPRRSDLPAAERGVNEGVATANGVKLAKDLANMPGNICTPTYLAEQAVSLADTHKGIKTQVLEEADMEALGMGALLGVSRGSSQPAKFIVMEYMNGAKSDKPTVLVGKGVTFDAGGISLKPGAAMDEMKYDMGGAASVFGAMQAAVEMELPINLVGVIAATENLPDGNAYKPGDILTSMSGQTIEILNTDAEGRLALADALTYVERNYDADAVVDMATLTGAAVIALGHHASALYGNNSPLRRALRDAGDTIGDRAWPMPLWEDYQSDLDSNFADMANVGGRAGGSITAASFLHRFARKLRWAHLDVAGTAWKSGKEKGATGRPVGLLTQYLIDRTHQA
ncbi:leucyl aminopeptidase [Salinisphaera hydrothermalis]|uniref:Probable cytosol aminopeptidase n=1 Tax=Salinisphaera hydrothermalis (strain C41B8) TaxID=1304275 RepID=A0A084ILT3_SALHC|nr:leucyl aminopeptidase [Salinisphaera hydrothermalis]KEZ77667.1 Leucyl aminopeptidase [Salinisphaera hydrothermalis C41B8]